MQRKSGNLVTIALMLAAVVMLGNPAVTHAATVNCGGGTSVRYPGTPALPTVIKLPEGFNGISLDPPPTQNDDTHENVTAVYRWEHVGTFATRSGTGSLTVAHWKGVTNSSSVTSGFGFSIGASASVGVGVPDVESVKTTLSATFGYASQITSSMSNYDKEGLAQQVTLSPNSAVQVWRLAIDFVAPTGASWTVGTENTITCSYPLDFTRLPLQVQILGNAYDIPRPPTDTDGEVVHYPAPGPKKFSPFTLSLLGNKPQMQAEAFHHWKEKYGARWTALNRDTSYYWSNINLYDYDSHRRGWRNCGLLRTGPANPHQGLPLYPICRTGPNTDCLPAAVAALWRQMGCLVVSVSSCPFGCPYSESGNSGPCLLELPSNTAKQEFIEHVCTDWSTIGAGGVPGWMARKDWVSTDPLVVEVGWNNFKSSGSNVSERITVDYWHGMTTGRSGQEQFSASLGVEVEATGTFDAVSVSGKLSETISVSQTTWWGVELSEDHKTTFDVLYSKGVVYDAYNLTVNYTVGSTTLSTLSNFVVLVDDGGSTAVARAREE